MNPESYQEEVYRTRGPYHRSFLTLPVYHPANLRYRIVSELVPRNLHGLKCLDFGGGDGALSTIMADKGGVVFIADHSQLALSYAKQNDPRLKLVLSSLSLPFTAESFDILAMIETLEHIPSQYEMTILNEYVKYPIL